MIQNREVEVSTLVLHGTIGSGAIPENGVSRRLVFQSWLQQQFHRIATNGRALASAAWSVMWQGHLTHLIGSPGIKNATSAQPKNLASVPRPSPLPFFQGEWSGDETTEELRLKFTLVIILAIVQIATIQWLLLCELAFAPSANLQSFTSSLICGIECMYRMKYSDLYSL
jgi:hypothetical protein